MNIDRARYLLKDFISHFALYDILLFITFILIASCIFFLAFICMRRKLLFIPLTFLGFASIISIPFISRYFMEEKFYKIHLEFKRDELLRYIDVYYIDVEVKNVGSKVINNCIITRSILYDDKVESPIQKYRNIALNYLKPLYTYKEVFKEKIDINETKKFHMTINNYKHRKYNGISRVECHG